MWSWVLHRITGVSIFFFLFAHVVDTAMVRVSPATYNTAVETYKNPVVGLMEVGLVGAVLFHALNGVRIILVDFWEKGPRYQRQLTYGVVGVFVVLFVPFVIRHLTHVFGGCAPWPLPPWRPRAPLVAEPPAAATSSSTAGCSCAARACCCWCWCSGTCS